MLHRLTLCKFGELEATEPIGDDVPEDATFKIYHFKVR